MHQLDARYRNGRIPEAFEAEHCIDPGLDAAMILLVSMTFSCRMKGTLVCAGCR
jgi:hypothetical protein